MESEGPKASTVTITYEPTTHWENIKAFINRYPNYW